MESDPNDVPTAAHEPDLNEEPAPYVLAPAAESHSLYWLLFGLAALAYVSLFFLGETSSRFALNGLQSLPFLLLAILAYFAERHPEARVLAFAYWLILMAIVAGAALVITMGAVMRPEMLNQDGGIGQGPRSLEAMFYPGGPRQVAFVALWLLLAGLFSMSLFLMPMRRMAAGLLPIYADSYVHAVALATVTGVTLFLIVPLMVLGNPPLLELLTHFEGHSLMEGMSKEDQFFDTLSSFVWLVPSAVLAVGFPFVRTIGESLDRVGLVRPSLVQIAFGLTAALLMVGLMIGVDHGMTWFWKWMGWPTTDGKRFEELMKFAINPVGAVVIGVTAGLGEELFARGVLQPRLGILLSNLLFTSMHALQYNWDGLTSVFLIGMILGVIRKKTNTSTSAIVHGTYDFVLIMLSYLGVAT